MIVLGIVLTVLTLVIIIFRIKAEVGRRRLSTKGGLIVGSAFALSLAAIVSVALLTTEDSLGIRLSVLALCIAFVFSTYKIAKRLIQRKTPNHSKWNNRKTLEPINTSTVWEFEKGFDPTDFFQALELLVKDNATIYLECSNGHDVLKNLTEYEIDPKYDIYPGTTWPRSNKLHLPLNEEVIKKLTEISKTHATPEYADHLVIYKDDEVIIEAYDFCIDPFHMSQRINESIATEFARRIKKNLRKISLG
jgi:hypothetical protein